MESDSSSLYRRVGVKTASPGRLVLTLYDGCIDRIDEAVKELKGGPPRFDKVSGALGKAQAILSELMASLDFEEGGEIARNLFHLYLFFNRELTQANIEKEESKMLEVRQMMQEFRDAWDKIKNTDSAKRSPGQTGINLAG